MVVWVAQLARTAVGVSAVPAPTAATRRILGRLRLRRAAAGHLRVLELHRGSMRLRISTSATELVIHDGWLGWIGTGIIHPEKVPKFVRARAGGRGGVICGQLQPLTVIV